MMVSTFDDEEFAVIRRVFAKEMLAISGISSDPLLEEALATIARERFLGPPPWQFSRPPMGYQTLPSCDPAVTYQDSLFALAAERGINNGSPSLHAHWIHRLSLQPGEVVAHLGAGTGYYTAVIAHMVGQQGHVIAVEYDPVLAERARANLSEWPNVTVVEGDGADWPRETVNAVYVNFSVERPSDSWINCLRPGGRLIFPLGVPRPRQGLRGGTHALYGAGLRVTCQESGLSVDWLGSAYFICAEGSLAASEPEKEVLKAAFERGGIEFVRSLIWRRPYPPERCWFMGSGWALSYDAAGA